MHKLTLPGSGLWLGSLASALLMLNLTTQAQTTPNVRIDILGTGAASLIGGDLTDPENDGVDALGAATDPSWNWASIDASHEPDFEGGENSFNIFDNKVGGGNDKWCCDDPTPDNPVWVAVEFKQPVSLTYFTVTSGNDSPDRDPTNWSIQGSNDGANYTDIYHFQDTVVPWTARNQVVKFTLPAPAPAYKYIRYIAYETPGTLHQINEIEYFDKPLSTDTVKPRLVSAAATASFDTVQLTFSEDVDAASAGNVANYSITPALAVTAVNVRFGGLVTLTTAKQTPSTAYTVTVNGVKDIAQNTIEPNSTVKFYSYYYTRAGVLKFSYWGNIGGTAVADLTADSRYPASPDLTGAVYSFNTRDIFPDDSHDNYGATMEGYLTPTESGNYRFFVYSDDASELWLSTDDKEANLQLIAQETDCCDVFQEPNNPNDDGFTFPTSEPVALVAGKNYYVRLILKEGGGGDYAQVAWRKEGDSTAASALRPIAGKFLSAAADVASPSEGLFTTRTPAPNATGVAPNVRVNLVHVDGKAPWTAENVTLKVDGAAVTPTFSKDGIIATVTWQSSALMASKSTHTISLGYPGPDGQPATLDWSFEITEYRGPTKDVVHGYNGLILGTADFTADGGGKSGKPGDYAIDFGQVNAGGQSVYIYDASFINEATAKDELSIVAWQKLHAVNNSSMFWGNSPSSSGSERGFQVHTPWGGGTLYFDTAGCCDGTTQRINGPIADFPGYSGEETWWQDWHLLVVQKKGSTKEIWIDGQLFLTGESTNPLPTDFNYAYWGYDKGDAVGLTGILDDAAIFGTALTEADITKLFSGTLPNALGGTAKLLAYWNFNDAKAAAPPTLSYARTATGLTLTFTGTLESATAITGPWASESATSPATIPATGPQKFYRAKQ